MGEEAGAIYDPIAVQTRYVNATFAVNYFDLKPEQKQILFEYRIAGPLIILTNCIYYIYNLAQNCMSTRI